MYLYKCRVLAVAKLTNCFCGRLVKLDKVIKIYANEWFGSFPERNFFIICCFGKVIHTMTMQMVDIFLLSFYLQATYQPFASPLYIKFNMNAQTWLLTYCWLFLLEYFFPPRGPWSKRLCRPYAYEDGIVEVKN